MRIRKADGTVAEVSDGYILADGEALMVGLTFMDARRMVRDARGEPAGTRPGFLLSDNEADEQARDDAYQQYAADISQRWRQGPEHRSSPKQAESQAFTNPEAAVAAAYAQYNRDIQERWRK